MLSDLYLGDCRDILQELTGASVSAIVTDPPYGIGYASSRMTRMNGEPRSARQTFGSDVFDAGALPDMARILIDGGALYLCSRWDVLHLWQCAIEATGLTVRQRIVWNKKHWGMGDLRYFGSQVEDILFATKGDHALRWQKRQGNVWEDWRGHVWGDGYAGHPTQKPVRLMRRMIELSTDPGDTVIDPYMGVGTTGVACMQAGRYFIGVEIDPDYFALAKERIDAAEMQSVMVL